MLQGDAASVLHSIVVVVASVQTTAIGGRLEHDSERPVFASMISSKVMPKLSTLQIRLSYRLSYHVNRVAAQITTRRFVNHNSL